MATLAELKSILTRRFRNRSDAAFLTAVVSALGLAQDDLEADTILPSFLRTNTTLTISSGFEVALPADFVLQNAVRINGSSARYNLPDPILNQDEGLGDWLRYSIDGTNLLINPPVTVDTSIQLYYYAKQPKLAADGDTNKWSLNAPTLLYSLAGMKLIADYKYDTETAQTFQIEYQDARRRLLALTAALEDQD
jgi:hypothetical protein